MLATGEVLRLLHRRDAARLVFDGWASAGVIAAVAR
jgi:hypothetical protein